jgi:mono/diheme cytochrome c family protein
MQNGLTVIALIVVAALLAWSGFRALRIANAVLKWSGAVLAALLSVAMLSIGALAVAGMVKQHARRAPVPDLKVEATDERIARGKAVADGFCGGCHTSTGTLTGGIDIGKHLPIHVGSFVSSNLTPAGPLQQWSDGEVFRAIRNSVDANGHWLILMSYTNAGRLSDDDTQDVIAYVRSVPAAGTRTLDAPDRLNMLGLVMLGTGMLPRGKPVIAGRIVAPPKGPTVQFGEYILSYQDCRACHGSNLAGGVPGQLGPLGPDLNVVKDWNLADFISTFRTGIDPDGHQLGPEMPWRPIGRMGDDELAAIYQYLTHMPGS